MHSVADAFRALLRHSIVHSPPHERNPRDSCNRIAVGPCYPVAEYELKLLFTARYVNREIRDIYVTLSTQIVSDRCVYTESTRSGRTEYRGKFTYYTEKGYGRTMRIRCAGRPYELYTNQYMIGIVAVRVTQKFCDEQSLAKKLNPSTHIYVDAKFGSFSYWYMADETNQVTDSQSLFVDGCNTKDWRIQNRGEYTQLDPSCDCATAKIATQIALALGFKFARRGKRKRTRGSNGHSHLAHPV